MLARVLGKFGVIEPLKFALFEHGPAWSQQKAHEGTCSQNNEHGQLKSLVVHANQVSHDLRRQMTSVKKEQIEILQKSII